MYVDKYIEYLSKELNYSENTIKNYEIDIISFDNYLSNKNKSFNALTKQDLRYYLKFLDKSKYSNKTIARKLTSLRVYFNFLVEINAISYNIFNEIDNPKLEKKIPSYLSYEDLSKLLDSVEIDTNLGLRNKLIFELIYSSGLRISEVSNLEISQINLDDNIIKVMGKGNKERIVYYGKRLEVLLKKYLQTSRGELLNGKICSNLFINRFGTKLSVRMIDKILKKICDNISFKGKVSAHTIRHTFATHLLNSGADIKSVQELLGHESLSTTEIYTHVSSDRVKSVYLSAHPREKLNNNIKQ